MADVICGQCVLFNASLGRCRITNAVAPPGTSCALSPLQRLGLLRQGKRIVAGLGEARELVIDSVTPCAGGGHITFVATIDGVQYHRVIGRDQLVAVATGTDPLEHVISGLAELVRMSGANTAAEIRALVEGHAFYLGGGS